MNLLSQSTNANALDASTASCLLVMSMSLLPKIITLMKCLSVKVIFITGLLAYDQ